jgi:hypothetical protein
VGKSALAQSLSEKFQEKKQLAASFFFFRGDPTRNNGDFLIPTLVSQLADSFEGIAPLSRTESVKIGLYSRRSISFKFKNYLLNHCSPLNQRSPCLLHPRLIVIDGLDECENQDIQCELLRVIAVPFLSFPIPFDYSSQVGQRPILRMFSTMTVCFRP